MKTNMAGGSNKTRNGISSSDFCRYWSNKEVRPSPLEIFKDFVVQEGETFTATIEYLLWSDTSSVTLWDELLYLLDFTFM